MLRALLAAALLLAAPTAASADTLTVDPADANDGCTRGTDATCRTIAQAVGEAVAGDAIHVLKGTYAESVTIPESLNDLELTASEAKLTGSGGDVLTIRATGVRVASLTIEVPPGGGSAVRIDPSGQAALDTVAASRTQPTAVDAPVLDVAGMATIARSLVVQQVGAAGTPAVRSSGPNGTKLVDVVAASSVGPAVTFTASDANAVQRSTLASSAGDAVQLLSGGAGPRRLVVDSSILAGAADAAGLLVRSTGAAAGASTVELRHATLAGAARGLELDANGARGPGSVPGPAAPAGSINARVTASIVHPASTARAYTSADAGAVTASNAVSLSFSDSDAPPAVVADGASADMGNSTNTPDAQLFARNFTLRQDAPAIDRGGALEPGESTTDVHGDPRGAATDKGADEFVNRAPQAMLAAAPSAVKQQRPATFTATATDPELGAGGAITAYHWDFGDGTRRTTATPTVSHAYEAVGSYRATVVATDNLGASSPLAAATVAVTDGLPPLARITAPADGARVRTGRKRRLRVSGRVTDASGVARMEVLLFRRLRGNRCAFHSRGRLVRRTCSLPLWRPVTARDGRWSLRARRGRLPRGRWEARVRATDVAGNRSEISLEDRSRVRFRVL